MAFGGSAREGLRVGLRRQGGRGVWGCVAIDGSVCFTLGGAGNSERLFIIWLIFLSYPWEVFVREGIRLGVAIFFRKNYTICDGYANRTHQSTIFPQY